MEVKPQRQSIAEIEALFPEQWILIDQPELDAWNKVVSGIAVFGHPDKKQVHAKAEELKSKSVALHCTRMKPLLDRYM